MHVTVKQGAPVFRGKWKIEMRLIRCYSESAVERDVFSFIKPNLVAKQKQCKARCHCI